VTEANIFQLSQPGYEPVICSEKDSARRNWPPVKTPAKPRGRVSSNGLVGRLSFQRPSNGLPTAFQRPSKGCALHPLYPLAFRLRLGGGADAFSRACAAMENNLRPSHSKFAV
jgi:hypothetical protein